MSNIRLQGNPSGTGTLTIASPNTNSDFTLNLPASGGTVLLDGATQSPTFNAVTATSTTTTTLAVAGNNISAVNSLGFRNRIINGDMRIDQRNAGASINLSGSLAFPVDRFKSFGRVAGGATGQQSSIAPAGFTNSLLYTVTSGGTPTSGDYACIQQFVEGFNFADAGYGGANAQTFTLSFWVRSSVTGTYAINLQNNNASRSYVTQYTINAANTWEQKSIIIAADTGGSWNTNNGTGLVVTWDMGFGYGNTSTTNTWLSGDFRRVSSNVQLVATTGATFYITGVQLEAGSVATPFERRDYGRELMLCQRYYEQWNLPGAAYLGGGVGMAWGTTSGRYQIQYQQKRSAPTCAASGSLEFGNSVGAGTITSFSFDAPSLNSVLLFGSFSSGSLTAGTACQVYIRSPATFTVSFSSEL